MMKIVQKCNHRDEDRGRIRHWCDLGSTQEVTFLLAETAIKTGIIPLHLQPTHINQGSNERD